MMNGVLSFTRLLDVPKMQRGTASVMRHALYNLLPILLYFNGVTYAQSSETALLGGAVTFRCPLSGGQSAQWRDDVADEQLFSIISGTVNTAAIAETDSNYAEYRIIHDTLTQFDLNIQPVNIFDERSFSCDDLASGLSIVEVSLGVNALPNSPVSMECIPVSECPSTGPSTSSSEFTCTCTAMEVYPETLDFNWENVDNPSQSTKISGGDLFDINGTATVRPSSGNEVTCTLSGYTNEEAQQSPDIEGSRQFVSPTCTLVVPEISENTVCSAVPLRCDCEGADAGSDYSFYNGDDAIGSPSSSNELVVNITQYSNSPNYYCRVCNGIYYDEESIGSKEINCPPLTTDKPDGTKAPTTASSTGLIIGIIAAVVVVICLVAFLVWFFKFRGGEDDPTATNPSRDGVQEPLNKEGSPKSKTKSAPPPDNKDPEIPAYGVVNKPKKTPEPAPRGNTMELQYADLDHGNAPPSNQIRMPEEPTEYATVQSVVV